MHSHFIKASKNFGFDFSINKFLTPSARADLIS